MNLNEALNVRANEIEKPPALPAGTYTWAVSGPHTQRATNNGDWDIIEFPLVAVEASDDVDPEALEAFGSLSAARNRLSFMFSTDPAKKADNDRTVYRLKRFLLDTLRVEAEPDATLRELLAAAPNMQFRGQAKWRPADDGEIYVDVANPMPLA